MYNLLEGCIGTKMSIKNQFKKHLSENKKIEEIFYYYYNLSKIFQKRYIRNKSYENELLNKFSDHRKKRILLVGTPNHGNIGDAAIAYAENIFLKEQFSEYDVIEIPENRVLDSISVLKSSISDEDMIFYHGGGNMSTIYVSQELSRQEFVMQMKEHKIISFPQSIILTNNETSRKMINRMKRVYSNASNLILCARENGSLKIMQDNFTNVKIEKCPDIVLYLKYFEKFDKKNRKGAITLLRNDSEKNHSENTFKELQSALNSMFNSHVEFSDTTLLDGNEKIDLHERKEVLYAKWSDIGKYELTVTDRLHGMIFSYITKTPCLVLPNNNHKIISTYETWLRNCSYIKLMKPDSDFGQQIESILKESNEPLKLDAHFYRFLENV